MQLAKRGCVVTVIRSPRVTNPSLQRWSGVHQGVAEGKLLHHGPLSPHLAIVNHSCGDIPEQNCASVWFVKLAVWTLYLQKALPPSI